MEKTEDQINRERDAVKAMTAAKSNMTTVLERVDTLERALRTASMHMSALKPHLGSGSFMAAIGSNQPVRVTAYADDAIAHIAKVLG